MTLTVKVKVVGDIWHNPSEVEDFLKQAPADSTVTLDLCSEGPCLETIGLLDMIKRFPINIEITSWSNNAQQIPYKNIGGYNLSHFFNMSAQYWQDIKYHNEPEYKFGLFVGRCTHARNHILYDSVHRWPGQFLISKMKHRNNDPWQLNLAHDVVRCDTDWPTKEHTIQWINQCNLGSIDNKSVQDQYEYHGHQDTNRSLLFHYHQFGIELVCETYTVGNTFFPTEKTVRPMVGLKPWLIYGPKQYLSRLRDLGFQTYNQCWDESYDNYQGYERWVIMSQVIDCLCNLPNSEFLQVLDQAQCIAQHNQQILKKIISQC